MKRLLPLIVILWASVASAADIGINFRSTAGYCTDPANTTYVLAETYPTTRNSWTFGWDGGLEYDDRNSGIDCRLAGAHKWANNQTPRVFRIDLLSAGSKDIHIALGDASADRAYQYVEVYDNATLLLTIDKSSGTTAPAWYDAGGNLRSSAALWTANEVAFNATFASTTCYVKLGHPSAGTGYSSISHVRIYDAAAAVNTLSVLNAMGED